MSPSHTDSKYGNKNRAFSYFSFIQFKIEISLISLRIMLLGAHHTEIESVVFTKALLTLRPFLAPIILQPYHRCTAGNTAAAHRRIDLIHG